MKTVWIAEVETANFAFTACGTSPGHATKTLWKAWLAHCKLFPGADPDLLGRSLKKFRDNGPLVMRLTPGCGYRDHDDLWPIYQEGEAS